MEQHLYSIIIPHHNIPKLLLRCLNSIPRRNEIQIIVVDDNSKAEVLDSDEIRQALNSDIEFYFTKEGKGAGYARNVGLSHANGKWVLFADADDYFVPRLLDILDQYKNTECEMILFKAQSVDSDTLLPTCRNENINKRIDDYLKGNISGKYASLQVQSPWCRMIKRSFIEHNHIRFEEVISCNDTMFTTKATCLSKSILISGMELYVVTQRAGSLWASRKTNPLNYLSRIEQQILRNNYVKDFGFPQLPIIGYVFKARNISYKTFVKALFLAIRKRALFQGLSYYWKGGL